MGATRPASGKVVHVSYDDWHVPTRDASPPFGFALCAGDLCWRFVLVICLRFVLAICLRFVLAFCLKCPDTGHITPSPAHKSYFLTS